MKDQQVQVLVRNEEPIVGWPEMKADIIQVIIFFKFLNL